MTAAEAPAARKSSTTGKSASTHETPSSEAAPVAVPIGATISEAGSPETADPRSVGVVVAIRPNVAGVWRDRRINRRRTRIDGLGGVVARSQTDSYSNALGVCGASSEHEPREHQSPCQNPHSNPILFHDSLLILPHFMQVAFQS